MLIGGIADSALKATALALPTESLDKFLERMRLITDGLSGLNKKAATGESFTKAKEIVCRNCGKKGHLAKYCKDEISCFYCKMKGHRRFECPSLKKKEGTKLAAGAPSAAKYTAANVTTDQTSDETVAAVDVQAREAMLDSPFVEATSICGRSCKLSALVDTGSPVCFVKPDVYEKWIRPSGHIPVPISNRYRNLSNLSLNIMGASRINVKLNIFPEEKFSVNLHVLRENLFEGDIILGREFLNDSNLTVVLRAAKTEKGYVNMFSELPLYIAEGQTQETIDDKLNSIDIDFDETVKLKELLSRLNNETIETINDGYAISIQLKDNSIYAYAPRRFAFFERLQLREITDDLLNRGIIRPSISPYCARVVPVRKRDGRLRLCLDLRPLNSRVEKEKYPFPVIEDCLSRLANKKVFSLLDLKDGFH